MRTPFDDLPDTALARLFTHERLAGLADWFSLPGGQVLFEEGEPSDRLFLLRTGRLGVFRREEGGERHFIGVIRPGEPVGESGLIAGAPHSAEVVALRDSELLALPADVFFHAVDHEPGVMVELARLMIQRSRESRSGATGGDASGAPTVFGFLALGEGPPIRDLVESICAAIGKMGLKVTVAGPEALYAPTQWFTHVERQHDVVLFVAEAEESAWRQVVARQSDRLFHVGQGGHKPPPAIEALSSAPLQGQRLIDLILIQSPRRKHFQGSERWLERTGATRLFHLRDGNASDIDRMARVLTGRSVGIVLSGGGARAYAHIGAVKALREAHVPIDFVGGCSMGGIIAAGVGLNWDDAEMESRIRAAFVDSNPLDDVAFPMIALTKGAKVAERLREHFGEVRIPDMLLPFFCVSSNLTTGSTHVHRKGVLWKAIRASISLPGVLPPVIEDGNVLVDGAVLKNFPVEIMRAAQLGPVVGVDVTRGRQLGAADVAPPASLWQWMSSGAWRRGPPIVGLLMRSATVSTGRELAASRAATDLLVTPEMEGIDLRDWTAYEPGVEAGYKAMQAALAKLDGPVEELRLKKR
ncbi:MAG: cyclic nucleotide-binding protein [Caulobacteraceae bacterium]|nr:cyclic nucleotide-binding protein [Caulobacteraceae bacterium]